MIISLTTTSKTSEGRSATFRIQGLDFFSDFFFFLLLGCSNSDFFGGLNYCTISRGLFLKQLNLMSRVGRYPWRSLFLSFFLSLNFLIFFVAMRHKHCTYATWKRCPISSGEDPQAVVRLHRGTLCKGSGRT